MEELTVIADVCMIFKKKNPQTTNFPLKKHVIKCERIQLQFIIQTLKRPFRNNKPPVMFYIRYRDEVNYAAIFYLNAVAIQFNCGHTEPQQPSHQHNVCFGPFCVLLSDVWLFKAHCFDCFQGLISDVLLSAATQRQTQCCYRGWRILTLNIFFPIWTRGSIKDCSPVYDCQ